MNKKIKVIELLNKIANKEKLPKKIKWGTVNYILKQDRLDEHFYYEKEQGLASLVAELKTMSDLESEVEILEDNTEEIEELDNWFVDERKECREFDIQAINLCFSKHRDKINELVKAVKQIDNKLNDN